MYQTEDPKKIISQQPKDVYDFRDYVVSEPGPPRFMPGEHSRADACPTCHRSMCSFKWYWFYEATNQRFKAFIYRILNK